MFLWLLFPISACVFGVSGTGLFPRLCYFLLPYCSQNSAVPRYLVQHCSSTTLFSRLCYSLFSSILLFLRLFSTLVFFKIMISGTILFSRIGSLLPWLFQESFLWYQIFLMNLFFLPFCFQQSVFSCHIVSKFCSLVQYCAQDMFFVTVLFSSLLESYCS